MGVKFTSTIDMPISEQIMLKYLGGIMQLLGYGEDALTLWALKNKFQYILDSLKDKSNTTECIVYFRPSFGRSGGGHSSQFGEFDFIIITKVRVYLGESKWGNSSEIRDLTISLREEQLLRHLLFEIYIQAWLETESRDWDSFSLCVTSKLEITNIDKLVAPKSSLLQKNIQTVLTSISDNITNSCEVKNVLLYLYSGNFLKQTPIAVNGNFEIICIDYSEDLKDNFIKLDF